MTGGARALSLGPGRGTRPPDRQALGIPGTLKQAFVFPGQGSQAVGMGKELAVAFAAAREVFEEVDEVLNGKRRINAPGDEACVSVESALDFRKSNGRVGFIEFRHDGGLVGGGMQFEHGD